MSKKNVLLKSLVIGFFCIFLVAPIILAQESDQKTGKVDIQNKNLGTAILKSKMSNLTKTDEEMKALHDKLTQLGYEPLTSRTNYFGQENVLRDRLNNKSLKHSIIVQDYSKKDSKDSAALIQITLSGEGRSEYYSFYLIAPQGDFKNAEEYRADPISLGVTKANSWWSCVQSRLGECGATCLGSLLTCPKANWAGYLACVAVRCGGCYTRIAACCTCNCSWWCKWGAGCCQQ
ncbi:MAG: hypothetical protein ACM3SY_20410 [Candidatus Omnitrophota bacterium]